MTAPLLEAADLARHYAIKRGLFGEQMTIRALAQASFQLYPGKTLAVVGESGCGKSTLARIITLIESPSAGWLAIHGQNVANLGHAALKPLRRNVQMVFQNPYGSLNPRKKIGAILEEPLIINTHMKAAARRAEGQAMMVRVGLRPEHYRRYPHMFSGGQRQRIAIARALMLKPSIVVLDEPVSALDVSIQAQILNLLADLQSEFGLAYLFISHDLSVVRHIADEVLVMYLGRVVEHGPRAAIFAAPRHPYTQALLSATPIADPGQPRARIRLTGELPSPLAPPSGCAFHPRCRHADDRCRREVPVLLAQGESRVACHAVAEGRIGPQGMSAFGSSSPNPPIFFKSS
ncbi:MAG: dipeptide ABC transporter ATP-binding protein [Gammaproteobacteria bacterium]